MEINQIEKDIIEFWNKDKTFEKSLKKTKGKKPYVFYDGPPFATGTPHYGHILSSVTKDIFGRFWTMRGRYVNRVWGWDCHGLPIENIAEKALGINSKDEIEKIGIKKFNDFCRGKVLEYDHLWKKFVPRIGRWVDMENSYKTMDNEYIESIWWAFKQLWEKGYIYKGEKILMYCPRCATPLAKAEIAMDNSYKNLKEDSVVVKFKLKNENTYALAWTTTPWTLPSNLALAVNSNLDYVYVKDKKTKETYILAKNVVEDFFKDKKEYDVVKELKGKKLEGQEYEPLFDYFKNNKNSFKIILGDFVSSEEGTGIVHTAPAFGEEDYEACKKYDIKIVQPVDDKGKFTSEVSDFAGEFVHDTNNKVIAFLKNQNKIVLVKKIEHEYPFCYRCDTKLIYRAIPAWFVNIQKIKPRVLELSQKMAWYPEFLKKGRVKYTIETAPDWNISRNRYWATAIPIWMSDDGETLVIESIKELKKYAKNLPDKIDLHKDYLDNVVLEKNGKTFKRIPEVLDCWFESGAMTFAQFHYPFENKEEFESSFPAQFVTEYIGQIRAWFYYMLVLSAIIFDKAPFENVVTTGTILAEDGQKISKSKNNFTDPMILIEKYGVDALRFYLMSSPLMNAENLNFSDKGVDEVYKRVILIAYNALRFYEMGEGQKISGKPVIKDVTDKWIVSRLNEFGIISKKYLEEYDTVRMCGELRRFVEDLSTWYIRVNRDRFEEDKNTRKVLGYVLVEFSKIIAPILPFVSESIYQSIEGKKKSVHLENYPSFSEKGIDRELLSKMETVREIVSSGLKERDKEGLGLRWSLSKAKIIGGDFKLGKAEDVIIKNQLNVKKIFYVESSSNVKEINVELDTEQTPELEAEGFARELVRQVQAERKNAGLVKKDFIDLVIQSDDKDLLKKIDGSYISKKVNAKKFSLCGVNRKGLEMNSKFKIKGKEFQIGFSKV